MNSKKISVFLADDHALMRQGIRSLLRRAQDIQIVGEASDGREAVAKVQQLTPDVVVMDITMPGINGIEATRQIKVKLPMVKVLVLTMHDTSQYLSGMFGAGVSGYILKTTTAEELVSAIRAVHHGDVYLYPSLSRMLVADYLKANDADESRVQDSSLTAREWQILRYIAEDAKNKEIASTLGISVHTVQAHRTNLMDKIGAHDRTQLVKYAISNGLIDL